MSPRRKSLDSSDSSDSDSDSSHKIWKKEKKDKHGDKHKHKEDKHKDKHGPPQFPSNAPMTSPPPPNYTPNPPSSGYRLPLATTQAFPANAQQLGPPPCTDLDGSPIYIGSALFDNSVHPCKIGPHLQTYAAVAYAGAELLHSGRFDLLPFLPEQMEWVHTSGGRIPQGRRPVEGGYEESGAKLYHAIATIDGLRVPGKTGEHLGAANVSFGGAEHVVRDGYEVLCWR
ncbi:hypothetical protein BD626DRAFT_489603 [Schizophyllum amplum]|uniref:Uncharacterized protein n=1 Tax=Schizophyllum amplum TaxID=97359 RepID=A0A550CIV0_9AGAR|nr:hypothetical protein BD626DRAFT_489603 [Auriculariopsis ampla]